MADGAGGCSGDVPHRWTSFLTAGRAATAAAAADETDVEAAQWAAVTLPPPPAHLDRDSFTRAQHVLAVRVECGKVEAVTKALRGKLLVAPNQRPVVKATAEGEGAAGAGAEEDERVRIVRLSTSYSVEHLNHPADVAPPGMSWSDPRSLIACPCATKLPDAACHALAAAGGVLVPSVVTVTYADMGMEAVMRALLPPETPKLPSGFEAAGHVAHVNLRDELWPWRFIIGQVILDKNRALRTVVAKSGIINTTFRTFPMQVVAGEDDTNVTVRHTGATFRFDFRAVYWNSKLQHEHERVVTKVIPPGAVVADMFCGVGPFAIPAAMPPRNCIVHANDLNPASYAALVDNVARNDVSGRVTPYNMDARDFVRRLVADRCPFTWALMNLPADAIQFLDVFVGLYRDEDGASAAGGASSDPPASSLPRPTIVVYCFSKAPTEEACVEDVCGRILSVLRVPEGACAPFLTAHAAAVALLPGLTVHNVRNVAPSKLMLAVQFTLPDSVATAHAAIGEGSGDVVGRKRQAGGGTGAGGGGGEVEGDGAGDGGVAAKRRRVASAAGDGGDGTE